MSVFPKISLRLEVENYLKANFLNKEVGRTSWVIIVKTQGEIENKSKRECTAVFLTLRLS